MSGDKVTLVSAQYRELRVNVHNIWEAILNQNFTLARDLCSETRVLAQDLKDKLKEIEG